MNYPKIYRAFALSTVALAALSLTPAARAQTTFFPEDISLDENNFVTGDAVIGYTNQTDYDLRRNGTSPNVVSGIYGGADNDIIVRNASTISFDGYAGNNFDAYDDSLIHFTANGYAGNNLNAYGRSQATLDGGYVGNALNARNFSQVTLNDAYISGDLNAYDRSNVLVNTGPLAGGIGGALNAYGGSVVAVNADVYNGVNAYGRSKVTISGANAGPFIQAFDDSAVDLTEVIVGNALFADGRSHVRFHSGSLGDFFSDYDSVNIISGGEIINSLALFDNSMTTVTGGTFGLGVSGTQNSSLIVRGGTFNDRVNIASSNISRITGGVFVSDITYGGYRSGRGVLNILGGAVGGDYYAADGATLNFYGDALTRTLIDPNALSGLYSQYELSGILADGTSVNGKTLYISNQGNAQVNLLASPAPEPGSLALIGGCFFGRWALGRGRGRKSTR